MGEQAAAQALRSDARLVVIEAPAGCGKTFQAANLVIDTATALRPGKILVLTHTHAACGVVANKTRGQAQVEIRTIDSLIVQIAAAYHRALDLPRDVSGWARQQKKGYDEVSIRVANLLARNPAIAAVLSVRYPVIICDEHQDSSAAQHAVVMQLYKAGARLRVFGDPMQVIYADRAGFDAATAQWGELCKSAEAVETLDVGHRWAKVAPELGEWICAARDSLRSGVPVDLRGKLPKGLNILRAENYAGAPRGYVLGAGERKPIDACIDNADPLLVLSAHNHTVDCLRGVFARRLPIWEGHTRNALEALVKKVGGGAGKAPEVGAAVGAFLEEVGVGFGSTAFGKRFNEEIAAGCKKATKGKPAVIQDLAKILLAEPNHVGTAKLLQRMQDLAGKGEYFKEMKIDRPSELKDAIQLGEFADPVAAHSEITRRRTQVRPQPRRKTLSTVHKAKGLECERVMVIPCDAAHFADKPAHRCLLYVALSRPTRELTLVVPHNNPSPLLRS